MFQADTELWGPATSHPPCTYEVYDMSDATSTKSRVGRPSLYSEELVDRIVELIAEGYSERQIAKMEGMPSIRSIQLWKDEYPEFLLRSARARQASAERFREEALQVARDTSDLADRIAKCSSPLDGFPKGYVDAKKLLVQELNREAAIRDDSRFGDRKTVKVDATDTAAGMADVYAKMLAAVKDDKDV